jgi:hypothetical protein
MGDVATITLKSAVGISASSEPHNSYASENIIRVIKSRRIGGVGNVTRTERREMCTKFWSKNLKGRDHSEDSGVDGEMILEWILEKWLGWCELDHVALDRDQWRDLVNTIMNLRVPSKARKFLTS